MADLKKITRDEFEADFPKVVDAVMEYCDSVNLPEVHKDWFRRNLKANTIGGKYNRGMTVHDSVMLLTGAPLSDEAKLQANILGWCTELLQAFFLVSDDIMDSSKTRRGAPCWYLQDEVGMIAINDAFMLESCIFILLKKYFRSHPAYIDLVELFHDITLKTELGQLCDLLTAPEDHVDLNNFSLDKHSFIVIFKTAWYSFYLPVALALFQLNIATPKNLKQCEDVLIPLGEYFQIQDDYLDNFGNPEHIGKIGTDIQDNKCSWLINLALSKATPEQRAILDENYGRKDAAKEAVVKKLYDDMGLQAIYLEFEEKRADEIRAKIDAVDESEGLKKSILAAFLKKIYKRTK